MRQRGPFALIALTVCGALLATAGCASSTRGASARFVRAASAAGATPSPGAPSNSPSGPSTPSAPTRSAGGPTKAPTHQPTKPGPPGGPGPGFPPWCQMSDVRFSMDVAVGGDTDQWSGSITVNSASGRTCALANYVILRWRDVHGAVLPVKATDIKGPEPSDIFFAIRPGTRGVAGIYWHKYKAFGSTETCPPFATSLDIWLGSTLQDPHPELRPPVTLPWFTGTNASICGGTVQLEPFMRFFN